MDLKELRSFLVLAEELHFGKAAKKLFISQPPLSKQIKNLEDELGVPLFYRTKRKVRLTEYGEFLRIEAHRLFIQTEAIKNHIGLIRKETAGVIRFGFVDDVLYTILPKILHELKKKYPGIDTVLSTLNTEFLINTLRARLVDIAFIRTPVQAKDIAVHPLTKDTFSLILPLSHPLASKKNISLKELAEEPFVGLSRYCTPSLKNAIVSICSKAGFLPRIVHETGNINTIIRIVENNLGYSIIPSGAKKTCKSDVRFFELKEYPERAELSLAYNPEAVSGVAKSAIDLILSMRF
ncbi:MAG: LysR family transcriptional regulator [Candidatus Aminicenantes bacterium]|nr:LysR family transcriptional regulator [Candidatus Aminicenantes bacterium]